LLHERFTKLRELALRLCARRRDGADAILSEIDALSRDVHRHIHLENNVLIPRVVELENRLKSMRYEASDVRPE
jgi:hemerythrin-like domain-containing protein